MEQPEQYQFTQMVNYTMVFIARCFLIPSYGGYGGYGDSLLNTLTMPC